MAEERKSQFEEWIEGIRSGWASFLRGRTPEEAYWGEKGAFRERQKSLSFAAPGTSAIPEFAWNPQTGGIAPLTHVTGYKDVVNEKTGKVESRPEYYAPSFSEMENTLFQRLFPKEVARGDIMRLTIPETGYGEPAPTPPEWVTFGGRTYRADFGETGPMKGHNISGKLVYSAEPYTEHGKRFQLTIREGGY